MILCEYVEILFRFGVVFRKLFCKARVGVEFAVLRACGNRTRTTSTAFVTTGITGCGVVVTAAATAAGVVASAAVAALARHV